MKTMRFNALESDAALLPFATFVAINSISINQLSCHLNLHIPNPPEIFKCDMAYGAPVYPGFCFPSVAAMPNAPGIHDFFAKARLPKIATSHFRYNTALRPWRASLMASTFPGPGFNVSKTRDENLSMCCLLLFLVQAANPRVITIDLAGTRSQ